MRIVRIMMWFIPSNFAPPRTMTTLKKPVIAHRPPARTPAADGDGCISSDALLGEKSELKIRHNGETYSLRKTRLGKLILTK